MFDGDLFLRVAEGKEAYLELGMDRQPADAIDAIFGGGKPWKFDCAEFAEVIQLYALRETLGRDEIGTKDFNALLKKGFTRPTNPKGRLRISGIGGSDFLVKKWYAAGLNAAKTQYVRGDLQNRKGAPGTTLAQDAAHMADVGSIVTFTNIENRDLNSPWQAENAVSLGTGDFVAWGIYPYIVSADRILSALADATKTPLEKRAETVFVSGVVVPDFPWALNG